MPVEAVCVWLMCDKMLYYAVFTVCLQFAVLKKGSRRFFGKKPKQKKQWQPTIWDNTTHVVSSVPHIQCTANVQH